MNSLNNLLIIKEKSGVLFYDFGSLGGVPCDPQYFEFALHFYLNEPDLRQFIERFPKIPSVFDVALTFPGIFTGQLNAN